MDLAVSSQHREDINLCKGLAILLVVFGHLVARQDPQNVVWYEPLRRAIYSFHMPFFLYLSGLVAVYSGFFLRGREIFWPTVRQRAKRLLLPFFVLGLAVLAGKSLAAPFMFVDNAPRCLFSGLLGLIWNTAESPALSVWYLFVLFTVSIVTFWLVDGKLNRLPWLLSGALLLYSFRFPAYVYADRVGCYAPFFLMGACAGYAGPRWEKEITNIWLPALAILIAGCAAVALWGQDWNPKYAMLPLGAVSMPALHGMLRALKEKHLQRAFLFFGRYSFSIYLGNTICIGLTKALLLNFMPWGGATFLPFAIILMAIGIFGPIMVNQTVSYLPIQYWLWRYSLGVQGK